jgi:hypothetical protein
MNYKNIPGNYDLHQIHLNKSPGIIRSFTDKKTGENTQL